MIGIAINAGANHRAFRRWAIARAAQVKTPLPTAAPRMPPRERVKYTAANPATAIKLHKIRVITPCRPNNAAPATSKDEAIR